jgi:hypothetical protein
VFYIFLQFSKKTAQSKQSPNRLKIAQSGHPYLESILGNAISAKKIQTNFQPKNR